MQPPGTPQRGAEFVLGDTAKPNPARWFQTLHKVACQFTQYLIDIGDHHIELLCQLSNVVGAKWVMFRLVAPLATAASKPALLISIPMDRAAPNLQPLSLKFQIRTDIEY